MERNLICDIIQSPQLEYFLSLTSQIPRRSLDSIRKLTNIISRSLSYPRYYVCRHKYISYFFINIQVQNGRADWMSTMLRQEQLIGTRFITASASHSHCMHSTAQRTRKGALLLRMERKRAEHSLAPEQISRELISTVSSLGKGLRTSASVSLNSLG